MHSIRIWQYILQSWLVILVYITVCCVYYNQYADHIITCLNFAYTVRFRSIVPPRPSLVGKVLYCPDSCTYNHARYIILLLIERASPANLKHACRYAYCLYILRIIWKSIYQSPHLPFSSKTWLHVYTYLPVVAAHISCTVGR
jgi:hypothetical protein